MPEQRPGEGRFAAAHAVHVWHGRGADELSPADLDILDEDELRLVRARRAPHDAHYASAHAAMRRVFADHYLGGSPARIAFGRHDCPRCGESAHGRPRILAPATGLEFSLSRTGAHWALAVTAGERIGIDVECGDRAGQAAEHAARIALSERETAELRALEHPAARREFFLTAWTRKEAVLKAVGTGIATDLGSVEAAPARPGPVRVEFTGTAPWAPAAQGAPGTATATGPGWIVEELPLGEGLFAALAREEGRRGPVVLRPAEPARKGTVAV